MGTDKAKDIAPSERGMERGSGRRSSLLKGREMAIVNQTNIGTVSDKVDVGETKFWETEWSAYGLYRAHKYRS